MNKTALWFCIGLGRSLLVMIYLPKPTLPILPVSGRIVMHKQVLTLVRDPNPRKDSLVMLLFTSWVRANDRLVRCVRFWNIPAGIFSRGLSLSSNMVVPDEKVRLLRSVIPWLAKFSSEAVACFLRNPQAIIRISLNPVVAILPSNFSSICKFTNLTRRNRAKCHFLSYQELLNLTKGLILAMANFTQAFWSVKFAKLLIMPVLISHLRAN